MNSGSPLSQLAARLLALQVLVVLVILPPALLFADAVQAQPPRGERAWDGSFPRDEQRRAGREERVREWRERSPEQRALIRERFEEFRRLRPEQQQRMQERFREFQAMPEAERRALRERFREFQSMPEAERRDMRERFRDFRDRRGGPPLAPGLEPGPGPSPD